MTMPRYDDMYLEILTHLSDGEEYKIKDIRKLIEKDFHMTEEEINEQLSSGQRVISSRVGWAKSYLKNAGLIENNKRGLIRITDEGLNALKNEVVIDNNYLLKYESFREFLMKNNKSINNKDVPSTHILEDSISPEETFDRSFNQINEELKDTLLNEIMNNSPEFFEQLVLDLLLNMGYGSSLKSGEVIGQSHDGGIDAIISQDKLGLENIYIQAKRYQNTVEIHKVRDFVGSLNAVNSNKGVFITTSNYSKDTKEFIKKVNTSDKTVILINGQQLTTLMIEYDIGVNTVKTYKIKKLDTDYFDED